MISTLELSFCLSTLDKDKRYLSVPSQYMPRNHCSTSYGLIVKTRCGRIVVIRRKVPYCVQNYFMHLHKRKRPGATIFSEVRKNFEIEYFPRLKEQDRFDYNSFLNGDVFEDKFDFPHGQVQGNRYSYKSRFEIFFNAYREFQEETGFRFSFTKQEISKYPLVKIEFIGCDGNVYTQYFFIVENVRGLKRYSYFDTFNGQASLKIKLWNDDRLIYHGELIKIEDAFARFKMQQIVKLDYKYLLCMDMKYLKTILRIT
jgi:hypothetical protein